MKIVLPFVYSVTCLDRLGRLRWYERIDNLTTIEGENSLGNIYLRNSTQIPAWFIGLKGTGAVSTADTAASHAAWTEFTSYSESVRQTLTLAAFSAGASNNTAAPGVFTVNGAGTVGGAFVASVSTKGSGSGVLFSVANFSADLPVEATDVLTVNVSVT